ncbi:hypothetical protein [Corynebacterium renale]|uniref:hypothetical protein n=1 Tax=Corynebacterium renale TaxID=1724 RepID=UPI000A5BAE22|nr:hypothetical protein [Corynebacterium renale]
MGCGRVVGNVIGRIISRRPGVGSHVVRTAMSLIDAPTATLSAQSRLVAGTNASVSRPAARKPWTLAFHTPRWKRTYLVKNQASSSTTAIAASAPNTHQSVAAEMMPKA